MAVWITVDVDLWKHPKMAALPSDSARWGWLVTLSEAKQQRKPGTFASARHYREVVGRFGRYLQAYVDAKLMDEWADGVLVVHDWKRHQWAVAKTGQREDKSETTEGLEEDASRAVSVPVYVSSTGVRGAGEGDDEPEFPLLQWLAQHKCQIRPGDGFHRALIPAVEKRGAAALLSMFEKLVRAGVEDGDTAGFVWGAIDALKPKPDLKAVETEDVLAAERARSARRQEQTKQRIAELQSYVEKPA